MDKYERETRDLMNVESFSQLPFIRPAVKEKSAGGAIRLFGKDFTTTDDQSDQVINENNINGREGEPNKDQTSSDNNNSRKFECHYCCRNFPTSQALGGHQNAHKRERQHAKHAHLQSAMMQGGLDAHDYSIMSYNRLGRPAPTNSLPIGYHSWNGINISTTPYIAPAATVRLYGNVSAYNNIAHRPLINGSQLATWRIPTAPFSRELASVVPSHPLFNSSRDDHLLEPLSGISTGLGSQSRFGHESKASMQDHVSLDLHL